MKILVAVKRVIDANIKVRVKADRTSVELDNVKMAMNPFCEIAVEESIRLKEQGIATETLAVSVGPEKSQDTLRTALAVGMDRAILIPAAPDTEPLVVAKCLAAIVKKEDIGLCILGKQSVDGDNNQTGQMLSALLGWPLATFVSKLEHDNDSGNQQWLARREVDTGMEQIRLNGPSVVTVDLRLNEPRYASLPNIMKARKKPLETIGAEDLGVSLERRLEVLELSEPPQRQAGIRINDASELCEVLKPKSQQG